MLLVVHGETLAMDAVAQRVTRSTLRKCRPEQVGAREGAGGQSRPAAALSGRTSTWSGILWVIRDVPEARRYGAPPRMASYRGAVIRGSSQPCVGLS